MLRCRVLVVVAVVAAVLLAAMPVRASQNVVQLTASNFKKLVLDSDQVWMVSLPMIAPFLSLSRS